MFTFSLHSFSVRIIARTSCSSSIRRASCDAYRDICLMGAGAAIGVGARATSCTTMADAGAAAGGGALVVFAGAGTAAGGSETAAAADEMTPPSSETSFGGAVFPLKY